MILADNIKLAMDIKFILFTLLAMLLSGCASNMASQSKIALEPLPIESAPAWKVTDYKQLSQQVFTLDYAGEIRQYIAQVLTHNPDLKAISATVNAARDNVAMTRAGYLPRADLNLSKSRNKDELRGIGKSASVSVDIGLSLDIWGKLADEVAAARHFSDKTQYDLQQLKRVLISQAARLWIEYRGYVHIEKQLVDLNKVQANVVGYYQDAYQAGLIPFSYYQGAFQVGLVPYEFFLDAKNSQRQSKIRLQEMQLEKLKTRQFMNILRGRFPADELHISEDQLFPNLASFSAEIPATALANRPDIQAAFSELQAFNRLERSANKALLPQLNLSAALSKSGQTLKKALTGDLLWQLVGGLTQPLFNGGQLRAIARQKSAEAEAVWWQYQNRVLKAMLEVESALASDTLLRWQLEQAQAEVSNLEKKIGSAKERFSDGNLSLSDYLLIKIEQIEMQMALNDVEVLYLKNRIVLITVLGLPIEATQQNNNGENSDEKS